MEQPRGGWEPIALAQDQAGYEPSRYWAGTARYWAGSGKAVCAAVLATLFGALSLWGFISTLARHDRDCPEFG